MVVTFFLHLYKSITLYVWYSRLTRWKVLHFLALLVKGLVLATEIGLMVGMALTTWGRQCLQEQPAAASQTSTYTILAICYLVLSTLYFFLGGWGTLFLQMIIERAERRRHKNFESEIIAYQRMDEKTVSSKG